MTANSRDELNESPNGRHHDAAQAAVLVYITVPDEAVGRQIAEALIERRLAACVNMVPQIVSVYRWEGEVQIDSEGLLLAKTRSTLVPKLRTAVAELHPYSVPAISTVPLEHVHPPYLEWLLEETAGHPSDDN